MRRGERHGMDPGKLAAGGGRGNFQKGRIAVEDGKEIHDLHFAELRRPKTHSVAPLPCRPSSRGAAQAASRGMATGLLVLLVIRRVRNEHPKSEAWDEYSRS